MGKKTYENRKKMGVCVSCGKEREDKNYVCCKSCRDNQKKYSSEARIFYLNLRICPRCKKNRLFGTEKTCIECLADISEERKHGKKKKYSSQAYRSRISKMKENGICRGCAHRKVEVGKTYCSICLQKKRERAKQYLVEKNEINIIDRHERPNYGLCYFCGNELDRNGRSCQKCADKTTANLPHDKGGKNEYWRQQNKIIFKKGKRHEEVR